MKKILFAAFLLLAPLAASAQQKFGHFNASEIMEAMPEAATMTTELQALAKQYEDEQKRMEQELQKKFEEYQQQQADLLPNIRERREQELTEMQQRYQESMTANQTAFQKARMEKLQAIQEKLLAAVKQVGEAGGYIYLMDTSGGAVPFINTSLSTDVSPEIRKALGL
ncbi:MAG: OmpH family outer membrane protein [Bacteroidaceae bacterium]|nr:OmpH family outer membrane protein [Bacteroidaceae bacterium]